MQAQETLPEQFAGFPQQTFPFFRKLQRNNRREWFAEHKREYEQHALAPMLLLVHELADALHDKGLPLAPAQRSPVFRIYRDIRFSTDKTPFKTHVSSVLYRDGDKKTDGFLYVHIGAAESFVAAGFWQPEKAALLRWREHIAAHPESLLSITWDTPLALDDTLTRMPRGFEQYVDTPAAPLLRLKSFVLREELSDGEIHTRDLLPHLVRFAQSAEPLLRYGWSLDTQPPRHSR